MLTILAFFPQWLYAALFVFSTLALAISIFLNIRHITIVSTILMAFAAYSMGVNAEKTAIEAEANKLNSKIEVLKEVSENKNFEIREKIITKIKYIERVTNANNERLEEISKTVDDNCKLTNSAVLLHDASSQNEVSGSTPGADAGTSEIKASELLETVSENYGTYYEVVAKLKAWQEWYRTQKQNFELAK